MSGATGRREDEQVPQFFGRIDEKFAEWETDVRLWQVEFKVEDRDRLGDRESQNINLDSGVKIAGRESFRGSGTTICSECKACRRARRKRMR